MIFGYVLALLGLGLFGLAVARGGRLSTGAETAPTASEDAGSTKMAGFEAKSSGGEISKPILIDWTENRSLRTAPLEHHFSAMYADAVDHIWDVPKPSQYYLHVELPVSAKGSSFTAPRDEVKLSMAEKEVEKSIYRTKLRIVK